MSRYTHPLERFVLLIACESARQPSGAVLRAGTRLLRDSLSCGTRAFGVSQLRVLACHCFVTRLGRDRHSNFTESPVSPSLGAGVCNDEHQFSIRSNQVRLNSHDYTRSCQHHHRYCGLLWLKRLRVSVGRDTELGIVLCSSG
jgi:hypothetical protein